MKFSPLPYPSTSVDSMVDTLHGVAVPDPYRWLEDGERPEVQSWTAEQNALTQFRLSAFPGRQTLANQLDAMLDVGSLGTPAPRKGRYFHTRRTGKQNQPLLLFRQGLQGHDRVLIDVNELAPDGTLALDWWYPSRDGRLLAYGLSQHGTEQSTLRIRDVDRGVDLPDQIDGTRACSVAWLPDGSGFYYTRYPTPGSVEPGQEHYHRHVFFHRLGDDPTQDERIFGAGRAAEDWTDARLSPSGRWLIITVSQGWSRSEVYFRDLENSTSSFVPLVEGVEALFHVTPRDDRFYVHTNDGAPRYRLMAVNPLRPRREDWEQVIPEQPDVLELVAVVGEVLVADYMRRAASRVALFDLQGHPLGDIPLPTLGSVSGFGAEWDGEELFLGFQSFTVPPCIYRVDLRNRLIGWHLALWDRLPVFVDQDKYHVEQVEYPSRDGTPVTMFLIHRKGLVDDGTNPTLLYGYGGFNICLTPTFSLTRLVFLERGGVLAIPNLRGGGEYGESWHQAGMRERKQNVFDDYLCAAEWLIANDYTNPARLAAQGGSNGGLLVGAALTQRPDLFRAVVCQVPLLDMVRYHRFRIARLWIPEYGDPDQPDDFQWLHAYSPYHQVREGVTYPATLFATAESDTRVDAMHARKMAARLQAVQPSGPPILLRLEARAGHGAGKPRSKVLEELLDVWCFLFEQLGMEAN